MPTERAPGQIRGHNPLIGVDEARLEAEMLVYHQWLD